MEKILKRIKAQFDPYYEIPFTTYKAVIPYLDIEEYPPRYLVKRRSMVEVKARYLLEGGMGLYAHTEKGVLCQKYFKENQIACDFNSYIPQMLSNKLIKTYVSSVAVVFYKKDFNPLTEELPDFAKLALRITEEVYNQNIKWQERMAGKNAKERVRIFLKKDPHALQLLPQKDIANMLSMSPEVLSRILKELEKEGPSFDHE
ncbi:Crp/Fnr family transcriptional regulator [Litoribacter populi]|uniref:Crp/Fnr family transcriptional regulator n=1 Tax=Litoribacter populi TaxID=2598460 RepID=UPI00163D7EFD|nr:helix-turn-helix domain-containing protein [Litoribacter populi]